MKQITPRRGAATIVIAFILLLSACGNTSDMPPSEQILPPKPGEPVAIMTTNKGVIKIKLFPELVPETVKNFTELAKKGFYNGLTFHRVIPNFMIQGGDPSGNGTGGESYKGPGTTILDEFTPKLTHIRGALSMANRSPIPNTGSSQFFIVQNKEGTPNLNNRHAVFGQVFEGLSVVDAIAYTPTLPGDMPQEKIIIEKVAIE